MIPNTGDRETVNENSIKKTESKLAIFRETERTQKHRSKTGKGTKRDPGREGMRSTMTILQIT